MKIHLNWTKSPIKSFTQIARYKSKTFYFVLGQYLNKGEVKVRTTGSRLTSKFQVLCGDTGISFTLMRPSISRLRVLGLNFVFVLTCFISKDRTALTDLPFTLTYFMLRVVHPVVIVVSPPCSMELGVRVWVRVAVVNSVEFTLTVENASALAGQGGHAEPAESTGQSSRFVPSKGRRPTVSSHLHTGRSRSKVWGSKS